MCFSFKEKPILPKNSFVLFTSFTGKFNQSSFVIIFILCFIHSTNLVRSFGLIKIHFIAVELLIVGIEIYHPLNAEFVREHSEIRAPESIRKRHSDVASFGESVKKFVGFFFAFGTY